jgi:glycosyltransferase involved in cell wall biosynthesis
MNRPTPPVATRVAHRSRSRGPGPKRVLMVFGSLERSGSQLRSLEICRDLRDRYSARFDFCTLGLGPTELAAELDEIGATVHEIPLRSPGFVLRFSRLLRTGRFDVVDSVPKLLSGIVLWLSALHRVPIRVATFYNSLPPERELRSRSRLSSRLRSSALFEWMMRSLIRRYATSVIGVSREALDTMFPPHWQSGRRCQVVYSGIPLSDFAIPPDRRGVRDEFGWPPESRVVVNVGRLTEQKNHPAIVETVRLVHDRDPRIRLLLIGDGRLRGQVDHLLDMNGLREVTAITGHRTDVPRLLASSDVFLFPSRWEGLPGAALEALASGLPVVASDIPPMQEIAAFFPDIVFLSPPDYIDQLSMDVRRALEMNRDRESVQARFATTPFAFERSVSAHGSIYELG